MPLFTGLSKVPVGVVLFTAAVIGTFTYFYATQNPVKRKRSGRGVRGLRNLGSTCFVNALLQGLAACDTFTDWIAAVVSRRQAVENAERSTLRTPIAETTGDVIGELHAVLSELSSAGDDVVTAAGVLRALTERRWLIGDGVEQDLFELFNVFVTSWEEQLGGDKPPSVTSLQSVRMVNEEALVGRARRLFSTSTSSNAVDGTLLPQCRPGLLNSTSLQSPLSGLMAKQLQCCSCGHRVSFQRVRHDTFVALSVAIPKVTGTPYITLENCLRRSFSTDVINDMKCDRCCTGDNDQRRVKFMQKQGISRFSNLLMIRVERVGFLASGDAFKHPDYIAFPEQLNMCDFLFYRTFLMDPVNANGARLPNSIVGGNAASSSHPSSTAISSLSSGRFGFPISELGFKQPALISGATRLNPTLDRRWRASNTAYCYKLNAVAVHLGTPSRGHFVTYRRNNTTTSNDKHSGWVHTSDTVVRPATLQEVLHAQAYMLFYERTKPFSS